MAKLQQIIDMVKPDSREAYSGGMRWYDNEGVSVIDMEYPAPHCLSSATSLFDLNNEEAKKQGVIVTILCDY